MLNSYRFSLRTLLSLLAIGVLSVATQAQRSQRPLPSGLGMRRVEQGSQTQVSSKAPDIAQTNPTVVFDMVDFPRSPDSTAFGINSKGDVVGGYGPQTGPLGYFETTGYVLKGNLFKTLAYPGAATSAPYGINKSGEIIGFYDAIGDGNFRGYMYKGSKFTNIDYPGSPSTGPVAINDAGEIAGIYYDNNNFQHGFTLKKGVYTTIDPPGSHGTEPYGINSAGVIVGTYYDSGGFEHGFVLQNGEYTIVDYPGASNTLLSGINDDGLIVGGYGGDNPNWSTTNIFLLDQGTFTPLTLPFGDVQAALSYTMNGNQFVGFYVDSLGTIYGFQAQINNAKQ